jgi:hypothetical protein
MTEQRDRVRAIVNDILPPAPKPTRKASPFALGALASCILLLMVVAESNRSDHHAVDVDRLVVEGLIIYVAEKEGLPRRRIRAELTKELSTDSLEDLDSRTLHTAVLILRRRAQ